MTASDEDAERGVLMTCFMHFFHMDKANASVHNADVRFSPLTFRLQEALYNGPQDRNRFLPGQTLNALYEVYSHNGTYQEDTGRTG
jgi:hypothetical protein